jgi:hypothetical protein
MVMLSKKRENVKIIVPRKEKRIWNRNISKKTSCFQWKEKIYQIMIRYILTTITEWRKNISYFDQNIDNINPYNAIYKSITGIRRESLGENCDSAPVREKFFGDSFFFSFSSIKKSGEK